MTVRSAARSQDRGLAMQRQMRVLYPSQVILNSTRCAPYQIARPRDGVMPEACLWHDDRAAPSVRFARAVFNGSAYERTAPLAQLQRREADHREDQCDDPEAADDLRFGPAFLLVVVVDRGHQEDPLAGAFEIDHLNDHRERLGHEEAAAAAQHKFVL